MASVTVHESSTHVFKLQYDSFTTTFNEQRSQVTVKLENVKMINENSDIAFNFSYKTFLVAKFTVNGKTQLIGANTTNEYYYFSEGPVTAKGERIYSSSYPNTSNSTFAYKGLYKAPYLLAFLEAEYVNSAATRKWSSISAGTKTFTIKVPDGAEKVQFYIYGDSDALYRYMAYAETPDNYQWYQSIDSCPCQPESTAHGTVTIESPVDIIVEPIKHNSNAISASHNNNRFTITVPPFVKGTNNPVKWQSVHINARRNDLFTSEYYPLKEFIANIRADWSVTARQNTNLKIVNIDANEDGIVDITEKYALENYGSSYSGYSAGKHLYEKVNGSYIKVPGGLNSLDINSGKYYLRITKDVSIKKIVDLENQTGTWTVGKEAIYKYPIPLTTIGPDGAIDDSDLNTLCIYGANWIWVDAVAKDSQESLFTGNFSGGTTSEPLCRDTVNGLYQGWFEGKPDANGNKTYYTIALISKEDYNDDSFFKDKPFSKDYFITSWHYAKAKDKVTGEYLAPITYGEKTLYLFEEVPLGDATGKYYLANRSYWSGDLRKTCNFDVSFYSFPRAPRRTGYLSTSTTNGKQKNSDDYSEEKPLRVRSKDILTFRWSDAFGDINKPEAPEGYRVYLKYKKDGKGTAKYLPLTLDEVSGINGQPKKIETNRDLAYNEIDNNTKAFGKITKINFAKDTNGQETNYLESFELEDDHISIIPKNFELSSGDVVYCQIISYITPVKRDRNVGGSLTTTPLSTRIYSNANEDDEVFNNFKGINLEQKAGTITVGGITIKTDSEGLEALYSSTYDNFDPNKSFIDGGRPSINDDYDITEISTELKGNGTVWVKVSDTPNDWVEGTPWVKTDKGWKEADSLHVKTDSSTTGWKESD